jgi:hypothetical protein
LVNGGTHQVIVWQALEQDQTVLQLNSESLVKELSLLLIGVNVVAFILYQVVELLGLLIHRMVSLAQIQELRKLVAHGAHWQEVATECHTELIPWHMVICWQCCSVRCPPGPCWTSEVLGGIKSLMVLYAV